MGGRVDSDIIFDLLNTDTALGSVQDAEIRAAPAPKSSPTAGEPLRCQSWGRCPVCPGWPKPAENGCLHLLFPFSPAAGARPDTRLWLNAFGFIGPGLKRGWERPPAGMGPEGPYPHVAPLPASPRPVTSPLVSTGEKTQTRIWRRVSLDISCLWSVWIIFSFFCLRAVFGAVAMSSCEAGGAGWDGACSFHGHDVVQRGIRSDARD